MADPKDLKNSTEETKKLNSTLEDAKETFDELLFASRDFSNEVAKAAKAVFQNSVQASEQTKSFKTLASLSRDFASQISDVVDGTKSISDLNKLLVIHENDNDKYPVISALNNLLSENFVSCEINLVGEKVYFLNRKLEQIEQDIKINGALACNIADRVNWFCEEIIKDEVNVREVTLTTDVASVASHELQVVPAVVGPRLGKNTQAVIVAVKKGDWTQEGDEIVVAGERLTPGEYSLKMVTRSDTASAALSAGRGIVLLDTEVTPELEAEGLARDVIRAVQQARRDAQLDVSDRIDLVIGAETGIIEVLEPHRVFISEETLSLSLTWDATIARQTSIEGAMIGVVVSAHR
jgi:hypothetical protein